MYIAQIEKKFMLYIKPNIMDELLVFYVPSFYT